MLEALLLATLSNDSNVFDESFLIDYLTYENAYNPVYTPTGYNYQFVYHNRAIYFTTWSDAFGGYGQPIIAKIENSVMTVTRLTVPATPQQGDYHDRATLSFDSTNHLCLVLEQHSSQALLYRSSETNSINNISLLSEKLGDLTSQTTDYPNTYALSNGNFIVICREMFSGYVDVTLKDNVRGLTQFRSNNGLQGFSAYSVFTEVLRNANVRYNQDQALHYPTNVKNSKTIGGWNYVGYEKRLMSEDLITQHFNKKYLFKFQDSSPSIIWNHEETYSFDVTSGKMTEAIQDTNLAYYIGNDTTWTTRGTNYMTILANGTPLAFYQINNSPDTYEIAWYDAGWQHKTPHSSMDKTVDNIWQISGDSYYFTKRVDNQVWIYRTDDFFTNTTEVKQLTSDPDNAIYSRLLDNYLIYPNNDIWTVYQTYRLPFDSQTQQDVTILKTNI